MIRLPFLPARVGLVVAIAMLAAVACGPQPALPQPQRKAPAWCEVLEWEVNANVVTAAELRQRISASGLPWRVLHRETRIELLLVPAGVARRGAGDDDEEAGDDERPAHLVEVKEPFYLGRFEVTQAQWNDSLGDAPSFFFGQAQAPVEQVDRFRVQDFLMATGFELPTEAQWEAACRAGDPRPRYGELEDVAWTRTNAGQRSHPVGELAANPLGFHDMLGNVWEWTADGYRADAYERCQTGVDAERRVRASTQVVLRGGSWYDGAKRARASARYFGAWDFRAGHVGLRVLAKP